MNSDPTALLAWMKSRGKDGIVTARSISDCAPRAFRRRADADQALSALIEAGAIVEICARPRAFRIDDKASGDLGHTPKPSATVHGAPTSGPVPLSEVRRRFDESVARHTHCGRSDNAARYMAGRNVHDDLRRDIRLAWPQPRLDRCCFCQAPDDGSFLRVHHGRLLHARCFGRHRSAVAQAVDDLIVAAIEQKQRCIPDRVLGDG